MDIPIIGGGIEVIGGQPVRAPKNDEDPRNGLIMELMATVSRCTDVLVAIANDAKDALARLDNIPKHALQYRLLDRIQEIANEAVTSDPIVGCLLRMESAMVMRFLGQLEEAISEKMTPEEIETVKRALEIVAEKKAADRAAMETKICQ